MKFNWGTGIFLTIALFVIIMLSMVYYSFQQKVNLISEDYYPKGIEYQDQIDKVKNTKALTEKPKIELEGKTVKVIFPNSFMGKKSIGQIHVYRPSDYDLDHKFDLDIDKTLLQEIEIKELIKGKYYVKVEWSTNSVEYYIEKAIFVK